MFVEGGGSKNKYNNALGHGENIQGGTTVYNSAVIDTAHAASEGLTAAAPVNVVIQGGGLSRKYVKNANVTELGNSSTENTNFQLPD